eukprot:542163_1
MLNRMSHKNEVDKYVTCTICNSLKSTSQFSYNQLETNKNKCKSCVTTLQTPPQPTKCYTCNIMKDKQYFSSKQLRKGKLKRCKACIISTINTKKLLFTDYSVIKAFDYKWRVYSTPTKSILLCNGYIRTQFTSKSNLPTCCISNICCNYFDPKTVFNQIHNAPVGVSECTKIFASKNFTWKAYFSPKKYSAHQTNCILSLHSLMYLNNPQLGNTNIITHVVISLFDNAKLIGHHERVFGGFGYQPQYFTLSIPIHILETFNAVEFGINIVLENPNNIPNQMISDKSFFTDKFSLCLPNDKNQIIKYETDLFEMAFFKWYLRFSVEGYCLCLRLYKADTPVNISTISILYKLIIEHDNAKNVFTGHTLFKKKDAHKRLDFHDDCEKVKGKILHIKFTIIEICENSGVSIQNATQYPAIKFIQYPEIKIWKPLLSTADFGIIKAFMRPIGKHQNDIELETIAELCYQYFVGLRSRQNKIFSPIFIIDGIKCMLSLELENSFMKSLWLKVFIPANNGILLKVKAKIVVRQNEKRRNVTDLKNLRNDYNYMAYESVMHFDMQTENLDDIELDKLELDCTLKVVHCRKESEVHATMKKTQIYHALTSDYITNRIVWEIKNKSRIKYFHFNMFSERWWLKINEHGSVQLMLLKRTRHHFNHGIIYLLTYKSSEDETQMMKSGEICFRWLHSWINIGEFTTHRYTQAICNIQMTIIDTHCQKYQIVNLSSKFQPAKRIAGVIIKHKWKTPILTIYELDCICALFCRNAFKYVPVEIIGLIKHFSYCDDQLKQFKISGKMNGKLCRVGEIECGFHCQISTNQRGHSRNFNQKTFSYQFKFNSSDCSILYEADITFCEIMQHKLLSNTRSNNYGNTTIWKLNDEKNIISDLHSFTFVVNLVIIDAFRQHRWKNINYQELVHQIQLFNHLP